MDILRAEGICKRYPHFTLSDVSFCLREGEIMGFIGRNGAGKSTTLKCMLDLVHKDAGSVRILGMPFEGNERTILQQVGFLSGGMEQYAKQKLRNITAVTRKFYSQWDEVAYRGYLERFEITQEKTPAQLSAGMRIKYALALALSHRARLLILDEPTSGLDPVSREEVLEIFLRLQREGVSILFSTHITSDLDKCADAIVYIRHGRIEINAPVDELRGRYILWQGTDVDAALAPYLIGKRESKRGLKALLRTQDAQRLGVMGQRPTLEDMMVHLDKEGDDDARVAL